MYLVISLQSSRGNFSTWDGQIFYASLWPIQCSQVALLSTKWKIFILLIYSDTINWNLKPDKALNIYVWKKLLIPQSIASLDRCSIFKIGHSWCLTKHRFISLCVNPAFLGGHSQVKNLVWELEGNLILVKIAIGVHWWVPSSFWCWRVGIQKLRMLNNSDLIYGNWFLPCSWSWFLHSDMVGNKPRSVWGRKGRPPPLAEFVGWFQRVGDFHLFRVEPWPLPRRRPTPADNRRCFPLEKTQTCMVSNALLQLEVEELWTRCCYAYGQVIHQAWPVFFVRNLTVRILFSRFGKLICLSKKKIVKRHRV